MDIKKILAGTAIISACILSCCLGYFSALSYIKNNAVIYKNDETDSTTDENTAVSSSSDKITASTKMVYEYYYADEGTTKVSQDVPPYFMIGLTFDDVVKYYTNWDIVNFSPSEVVMRKTVYGKDTQKYIVGEKNGYITIFYEENGQKSSIKEITSINTNGLEQEEKEKLAEGFTVVGDYSLNRVLENYSS